MSGWIKLHRSIQNHWLYTENRKFSKFEAWNDILLNVNHCKAKAIIKGKIFEINRGQSIYSLDTWAKRWNWDKTSVKRFLDLLKSDSMIELKNETVTTRLTVCNYDSYQSEETKSETRKKRKRNANETETKPIEEEEEEKETNKVFISPSFNDVLNYCIERKNDVDPNKFINFYESKGWMVGKNKMKDWKAAVRNWEKPKEQESELAPELQHLLNHVSKYGNQ